MRHLMLAAAVAAVFVSLPSRAATTTYDMVADWNPPNNPNGTWAYLQGTSPLPYQSSVVPLGGAPGYAPGPSWGNFLPLVWMDAGAIFVHSVDGANGNPGLGELVMTWTAPATGTVDITGYLYYGQPTLARSNDFSLQLGGKALASGVVSHLVAADEAHKLTFSFTGYGVTAGDVLSLTLQRSAGQTYGTVAVMDWTVTETTPPVPEAETYAMMLAGLGVLGAIARRRR